MYETLKGLTDLPIFIISIIFMILIYKKHKKSKAFIAFLLLSIASLFGVILHCIKINEPVLSICWVIECFILMILTNKSVFLLIDKDINKIFKVLPIVLLIPIILSRIFIKELDIYFVTLEGLLVISYMITIIIKEKIKFKNKNKIIIVLILVIISQILKDIIKYGVVIGHILIIMILYYIYLEIKDR